MIKNEIIQYITFVRPVITYGAEMWAISKVNELIERRILRKM